MAEIDRIIVAIHNQTSQNENSEQNNEGESSVHRTSNKPIVQVDKVSPNSPAQKAVKLCL